MKPGLCVQIHPFISGSFFWAVWGNFPLARRGIYTNVFLLLSSLFKVTTWQFLVLISDTLIPGQNLTFNNCGRYCTSLSCDPRVPFVSWCNLLQLFLKNTGKNDHILFLTYEKVLLLGFLRSSSGVVVTGRRIWSTILRGFFAWLSTGSEGKNPMCCWHRTTSSQNSISLPSLSNSHKSSDVSEAVSYFHRNVLVHRNKKSTGTLEENRNNKAVRPVCLSHNFKIWAFSKQI